MSQISFEFSFRVGKLQASLYKAISATEEKALADAVLEGFGLTFALRKYDMSVDLYLRNVTLAMIEQGQIRKPLLSSAHIDSSVSSYHKLVKVRYMKVQKDSPEFMTKHEGVDQSVVAELSTFKITVAPEPILALNDFIMTTFVPQDEAQVVQAQKAGEPEVVAQAAPSSDKIRVRVHLSSAQGELRNRFLLTYSITRAQRSSLCASRIDLGKRQYHAPERDHAGQCSSRQPIPRRSYRRCRRQPCFQKAARYRR